MRVLFDQCTPEALRKKLPGHDIQTANEAGVNDLENGDLIDEAVRRGYDPLVTADRRRRSAKSGMPAAQLAWRRRPRCGSDGPAMKGTRKRGGNAQTL